MTTQQQETVNAWLLDQIQAAESYGLINLHETGWWDLPTERRLEVAAYELCRLKTAAEHGHGQAQTFFRLFNRLTSPPWLPRAEIDEVSLPGRLAAITSYYNPAGYVTRRENYDRFAQGLEMQGVELWTIELSFDGRFELPKGPRTFRVRGGRRHIMWQKERLLTLLLARLPADIDKVAWIDCDVLFCNPTWPQMTCDALEKVHVVQLFDEVEFLGRDFRPAKWGRGTRQRGVMAANVWRLGETHPGFAWAARRSLLDRFGFVADQIGGSGDAIMALAWLGAFDHGQLHRYGRKMRYAILDWARPVYQHVRGRVSYVPGRIQHLWHGDHKDRRYDERLEALKAAGFDPSRHVYLDDDTGLYAWASDAPADLRRLMEEYFHDRREDGVARITQSPPVTCLMVTGHRTERIAFAREAVVSWAWQTYQHKKLLILNTNIEGIRVLTDELRGYLEEAYGVESSRISEFHWPWADGRTLGNLRNLTLQLAHTDCVVQWDDDDLSHPGRLAYQMRHWRPNTGSVFMNEVHVNTRTGEALAATARHWDCGGFPGTLLVDRSQAGLYPELRKGEDTQLVERLRGRGMLVALDNPPALYIRRWTGLNTWSEHHVIHARRKDGGRELTATERKLVDELQRRASRWNQ